MKLDLPESRHAESIFSVYFTNSLLWNIIWTKITQAVSHQLVLLRLAKKLLPDEEYTEQAYWV